jgi:OmpA-OmpF porin, OOP family
MKQLLKLLVIIIVIVLASASFAQERQGAFYISPYIGGYTFEGNQDLGTRPLYGLRAGYNFTKNIDAELVLGFDSTKYAPAAADIDTKAYNYRLEGLYNFMPDKRLVPFIAIGIGGQSLRYDTAGDIDRNRPVLDYGAGLKYHLTDLIALRADVRHVLALGSAYNNLEYTLGVVFSFGGKKEQVISRVAEQAPASPVAAPPIAAPINLSAAAVSESEVDLNWNSVKGATGYKISRDGQYVASSPIASLPDVDLNADTRYCYNVTAVDQAGKESGPSNTACAKTPAPAVAEMKKEAESGAAAVAKEMFEKGRATINVEFDTNKDKIKPRYHQEIEKFATVMKNYPELKVIIEGHTDNVGEKNYNQKLSQRRANSVKNYMVKNFGIAESRLTAKGYGLSQPIASNKDKAGRQKNRRVEAAIDYKVKK